MHETDVHDLSDDADYAASMQQGSASITRSDSSKRSSSSEPEGSQVVYLKDNVTIHPTQYASERISGRLKLIKQGTSLFMTWFPYKGQSSIAGLSEKDKNLYTIRAVPFTDVRSIKRHTPTLGWQYIIVVLSSGLAFPPLYFYNGGLREFLATVKQHVFLVRSSEDTDIFLVNDFQDPLQRSLSSLELPRVSIANGPSPSSQSPRDGNQERTDLGAIDGSLSRTQQNGRQRQKSNDPAHDLSIHVLEKFSLVTRFARDTTSQLFGESCHEGFTATERMDNHHSSHDQPSSQTTNYIEKVPDEVPVVPDPIEVDKLTLVWGKQRLPPLGPEEWATFLDSEGRVMDSEALRKRIFYGGVEHNLWKEVWSFLLEYYPYDSNCAEREYHVAVKKSEYETIKSQLQVILATNIAESSVTIPKVWSFLLEYYPYDSTCAEREYHVAVKKSEYETIKSQWQVILATNIAESSVTIPKAAFPAESATATKSRKRKSFAELKEVEGFLLEERTHLKKLKRALNILPKAGRMSSNESDSYAPKTILITGAAGFIASHVTNRIVKKYPQYRIVVLDKLDYCSSLKNLQPSFSNSEFQVCQG